jgi:hypothetical protein
MDSHPPSMDPSSDPGDGILPAPPPTRRARLVVGGVLALLLVAGSATAAVMLAGSAANVDVEMVLPADVHVAVIVSLDPPAGQKMDLLRLAGRFPDLQDSADIDREIDELLDEALGDLDLTSQDLDWVGDEVALIGQIEGPTGDAGEMPEDPGDMALVVATDDEAAAEETLRKARESEASEDWSRKDQEGVQLWAGADAAYAVDGGFAIVADDEALVRSTLEVLAGRAPALGASDAYTEVVAQLPAERLGVVFMDVAGVFEEFEELPATPTLSGQLQDLQAIRGVGMAASAEPDGIAFDVTVTYDPEEISDELREQLRAPAEPNDLLRSVPEDAYLVVGQKGYTLGLALALEQMGVDAPRLAAELRRYGVTGPGGLLDALTGDIAFEVGPGNPFSGSLLLATDDEVALQRALDRLVVRAGQIPPSELVRREIEGVTITTIGTAGPVQLAYAVADGRAIVASSPDRVLQALESATGAGSIVDDSAYGQITDRVPTEDSVLYVDVAAIVEAIREAIPVKDRAEFDEQISRFADPISGIAGGAESDPFSQHVRLFVQIPNKE